jgi:uncharacterized membrane protein YjgN (DUF898 family)
MNSLNFEGKTLDLIRIRLVKLLTTIFTLGLLHPWGKTRELKYLYGKTTYEGIPFSFNGNTRDFFKGFIKFWLSILIIIILCTGGAFLVVYLIKTLYANIIYSAIVILCTILAFYVEGLTYNGLLNYRINNVFWGSVNLSYTGKPGEMGSQFLINGFLTTITLGLYYPWFMVKFVNYILNHFKFGNITFKFSGEPKKLFRIYLKGWILTIITLGIYSFWFTKTIYEFLINNSTLKKEEQEVQLVSDANPLQIFELMAGNFLIVLLTLGLGYSWAKVRFLRFITAHSIIPEGILPEPSEPETTDKSFFNLVV